jgi:hypothetical protein
MKSDLAPVKSGKVDMFAGNNTEIIDRRYIKWHWRLYVLDSNTIIIYVDDNELCNENTRYTSSSAQLAAKTYRVVSLQLLKF